MNLDTWQMIVTEALLSGDLSALEQLSPDLGWRTAVYLEGFRSNDAEGLRDYFPHVAAWVETNLSRKAWFDLVGAFHRAFPPQHESRHVCYAPFPEFLATRGELPPWLADLARLHAAARAALVAPDRAPDPVESTLRLDRLGWDVLSWCGDGEPDLSTAPEERPNILMTWRADDLLARHAEIGLLEEHLLIALRAGRGPDPAVIAGLGVEDDDVGAALQSLVEAGLIVES